MKLLQTFLILSYLACLGCDSKKPSDISKTKEVTVQDLLWATEWNIYKWKVSDLTNVKLSRIQVVVVGPDGQIAQEGPSFGSDTILDPDMEVSLALKKADKDVMVKLRGQGSVSSTIEGVFVNNSWAFGPKPDIHNNLLVVATNSNMSMSTSKSDLEQNCNKICLKLLPYSQKEAEQATSSNGDKPSN